MRLLRTYRFSSVLLLILILALPMIGMQAAMHQVSHAHFGVAQEDSQETSQNDRHWPGEHHGHANQVCSACQGATAFGSALPSAPMQFVSIEQFGLPALLVRAERRALNLHYRAPARAPPELV